MCPAVVDTAGTSQDCERGIHSRVGVLNANSKLQMEQ